MTRKAEDDRGRHLRLLHILVTVKLVVAAVILAALLMGQLFFPGLASEQSLMMVLGQGAALFLLMTALLIRGSLQSVRRQTLQSRERQLQAMLSMFRVVKHELNNDMQVVVGNAELACMMLDGDQRAGKPVSSIREAATLAIDRIQQLSVFSASGDQVLGAVDLNALLRETVGRLNNEMPPAVLFRMELEPIPGRITADRNLLSLSLSYLIRLSARSLSDGGEIVVRTCHLGSVGDNVQLTTTAEISINRPQSLSQSSLEVRLQEESREHEQRERFDRVLQEAQSTTRALVERGGGSILPSHLPPGGESLIKMGFVTVKKSLASRDIVLEDEPGAIGISHG